MTKRRNGTLLLALETLVEAKFLRVGSDGTYVLFGP